MVPKGDSPATANVKVSPNKAQKVFLSILFRTFAAIYSKRGLFLLDVLIFKR
jgi:hypothetical protein